VRSQIDGSFKTSFDIKQTLNIRADSGHTPGGPYFIFRCLQLVSILHQSLLFLMVLLFSKLKKEILPLGGTGKSEEINTLTLYIINLKK